MVPSLRVSSRPGGGRRGLSVDLQGDGNGMSGCKSGNVGAVLLPIPCIAADPNRTCAPSEWPRLSCG